MSNDFELAEIRRKRLAQFDVPKTLHDRIVMSIAHKVNNHLSASIGVFAAEQNVLPVMTAITQFVADIESWGPTDCTTFNSFDLARQRLYLKYNILLEVSQKEHSHPDWSFVSKDVRQYTEIFYDHELNMSDPYFNTIKRDYYNEVSN